MTDPELTEFQKGARALFDYIAVRAANHWHSDATKNAACERENALVLDWVSDGLLEIDPESGSTWCSIVDAKQQLAELQAHVAALEQEQEHNKLRTINRAAYSIDGVEFKVTW